MCGRAALGLSDHELVALTGARLPAHNQHRPYNPSYNIHPTTATPIVRRHRDGYNLIENLAWGMVTPRSGASNRTIINARSETVDHKPMFKRFVDSGRCVMPTIGFYEWNPQKTPFMIKAGGYPITYLACIYDNDDRFAILTTEAAPAIASIHCRMPVVLEGEQVEMWIDTKQYSFDDCRSLLQPYKGELEYWQVAPLKGNDPSCIERVKAQPETQGIKKFFQPKTEKKPAALKTEEDTAGPPLDNSHNISTTSKIKREHSKQEHFSQKAPKKPAALKTEEDTAGPPLDNSHNISTTSKIKREHSKQEHFSQKAPKRIKSQDSSTSGNRMGKKFRTEELSDNVNNHEKADRKERQKIQTRVLDEEKAPETPMLHPSSPSAVRQKRTLRATVKDSTQSSIKDYFQAR